MPELNSTFVREYAKFQELDAATRKKWDELDKLKKKLAKLAGLGRKSHIVAPISESRGVRITDEWRTAMRDRESKIFTRAFCRRYEVKEVPLGD